MSDFLKKQGVQYFIIGLIVSGVLLVVFNPSIGPLQQGANFAVHITLAYLFGGIFFLILDQKNLMLTAFSACVVLCLFLKGSSNSSFLFPQINKGPNLTIAHVDISAATGNHDQFMKSILKLNADVISFQEVDPSWPIIFDYYLQERYPYSNRNIRIDPFGMAVYSKYDFINKDTLFIEDYQTLRSTISIVDEEDGSRKSITVLSSDTTYPNFDNTYRSRNRRYFKGLAQEILKSTTPVMIPGKFNMPYWNNELVTFKNQANLAHSRRDAVAAGLETPIDNVYFTSNSIECTQFDEILDSQRNHIGVIGHYQFKELEASPSIQTAPTVERF